MDIEHLLVQTCVVTHRVASPTVKDAMGDPAVVETSATYKGLLWQENRSEATDNRDVQQAMWSLALDASADGNIDGGDAVTIDGTAYELDGTPWPVRPPWGGDVTYVLSTVRRTS